MIRAVAEQAPATRVVVLGLPAGDQALLDCAEAGAAGYVSRDASLADLKAALQSAVLGELRCTPRDAAALLRRVALLAAQRSGPAPTGAALTQREVEIAGLIDGGLSNKEIARRLGIEVSTVKNHVHNILEKLQVHRRGEAVSQLRPRLRWAPHPGVKRGDTARTSADLDPG
jgi:DNA-binding NarL/FixJ family response regulator